MRRPDAPAGKNGTKRVSPLPQGTKMDAAMKAKVEKLFGG